MDLPAASQSAEHAESHLFSDDSQQPQQQSPSRSSSSTTTATTAAVTTEEELEQQQAAVEKKMREAIFTPFISESIIISEYDKRDARKSLAQIARSRIEEAAAAAAASPPTAPDVATSPPPLASVALASASAPKTMDVASAAAVSADRPPSRWQPDTKKLNLFLHIRGSPKAQGNLCFGCGAGMSESLFSAPRYCDFTGRFFCAKCHLGKKRVIPARVLRNWDFTPQPVNTASFDFLAATDTDALYDIATLNAKLYKSVPVLKDLRLVRKKLCYMRDFVASCTKLTDSDTAAVALRELPRHLLLPPGETYTLAELCRVDALLDRLMGVHDAWLAHITSCPLCSQKGSLCEICHNERPIYPFQLAEVVQCTKCKGLFHRACFNKDLCPRCKRRETRSLRL